MQARLLGLVTVRNQPANQVNQLEITETHLVEGDEECHNFAQTELSTSSSSPITTLQLLPFPIWNEGLAEIINAAELF